MKLTKELVGNNWAVTWDRASPPTANLMRKLWKLAFDKCEIYQWLEEEHNQAGASNPEWWQFREQINITDKLLTLLVMRWS
jgi:hypothetical protein